MKETLCQREREREREREVESESERETEREKKPAEQSVQYIYNVGEWHGPFLFADQQTCLCT